MIGMQEPDHSSVRGAVGWRTGAREGRQRFARKNAGLVSPTEEASPRRGWPHRPILAFLLSAIRSWSGSGRGPWGRNFVAVGTTVHRVDRANIGRAVQNYRAHEEQRPCRIDPVYLDQLAHRLADHTGSPLALARRQVLALAIIGLQWISGARLCSYFGSSMRAARPGSNSREIDAAFEAFARAARCAFR